MGRLFLAFVAHLVYSLWSATWRKSVREPQELLDCVKNQKPAVFAIWHGDELAILSYSSRYRLASMISTSKDGELMNQALQWRGFVTSRGSSTRGAIGALVGLIKICAEQGRIGVMAVDGPKGPLHRAKPGALEIAKKLQCPVFPGAVYCDRKLIFEKSWNKAFLPKPFSRVSLYWGDPIAPPPPDEDAKSPERLANLEAAIDAAGQAAAKLIAPT